MSRRAFIDTNVFIYAAGAEHPLREPCRQVIKLIQAGALRAETSIEVVQEAVHVRFRRRGDRSDAAAFGIRIARLCTTHGLELADLERAIGIFEHQGEMSMRDSLHAATMLGRELSNLISADSGFDSLPELRRIDPTDSGRLEELLGADP